MTLSTADCIAAIERHSVGFADAARRDLDAPVEHCPGWDVADLVRHLTDVHWFWATIAEERPSAPPADSRRPARAPRDRLVDAFEEGARRLVEVLRTADQGASCWTWAPQQQNVAFITRHQVQEAAVHHWDAAHAAGAPWATRPGWAADAVDEFLTVSLTDEEDARRTPLPPLRGRFALRTTDTGQGWTVLDGAVPGSVTSRPGAEPGAPVIAAPAADLMLWLYRRVDVDLGDVPADLVARFRADSSTD